MPSGAAANLILFNRFEKRREVAFAYALDALVRDDLEEDRPITVAATMARGDESRHPLVTTSFGGASSPARPRSADAGTVMYAGLRTPRRASAWRVRNSGPHPARATVERRPSRVAQPSRAREARRRG
jgi:hypothetical protein